MRKVIVYSNLSVKEDGSSFINCRIDYFTPDVPHRKTHKILSNKIISKKYIETLLSR